MSEQVLARLRWECVEIIDDQQVDRVIIRGPYYQSLQEIAERAARAMDEEELDSDIDLEQADLDSSCRLIDVGMRGQDGVWQSSGRFLVRCTVRRDYQGQRQD